MRAYWILPNREQNDDLLASDGQMVVSLRQILDPKVRPEGFSHGVPTELLAKCGPKAAVEILFAQRFAHWQGDKQLFAVSGTAGLDASGRVVHLGLLFILEPHERPDFDVPYAGLPHEDQPYASALVRRLTSPGRGDIWAKSVRDLAETHANGRPATNVALDRSVVRFQSLYVVGAGGSIRKAPRWKNARTTALILLILLGTVGVCYSVRAWERSARPAVNNGVAIWRSN